MASTSSNRVPSKAASAHRTPARSPLPFASGTLVNRIFVRSPVLFGRTYRSELERAPNLTVLLHANLLELETTPDGGAVHQARIGSLAGRQTRDAQVALAPVRVRRSVRCRTPGGVVGSHQNL